MTRCSNSGYQPVYEYKAVASPMEAAALEGSSGPSKLPSDASEGQSLALSNSAKFRFRSLPLKSLENAILDCAGR